MREPLDRLLHSAALQGDMRVCYPYSLYERTHKRCYPRGWADPFKLDRVRSRWRRSQLDGVVRWWHRVVAAWRAASAWTCGGFGADGAWDDENSIH